MGVDDVGAVWRGGEEKEEKVKLGQIIQAVNNQKGTFSRYLALQLPSRVPPECVSLLRVPAVASHESSVPLYLEVENPLSGTEHDPVQAKLRPGHAPAQLPEIVSDLTRHAFSYFIH